MNIKLFENCVRSEVLKCIRKPVLSIAAATLALGFASSVNAAECSNPDALTFAMVPTEETTAELELYKPVTDRMSSLTGKKIEFFLPTSYASVVEGLLGGFVHVAVLGPYSYVIANDKDENVEVFATYAKKPGAYAGRGSGVSCGSDFIKEQ